MKMCPEAQKNFMRVFLQRKNGSEFIGVFVMTSQNKLQQIMRTDYVCIYMYIMYIHIYSEILVY